MSRSYRKHTIRRMTLWGHNSMKPGKRYANRKIRRKLKDPNVDVSNGRYYRFLGIDSWDLWEYKSWYTKQEVIDCWEREQLHKAYGMYSWRHYKSTLEEEIADWKKYYLCK